jgi:DNA polymerase III alpha subunit
VLVGGLVTHRQRPATAGGVTFINLEDETGMLNVIVSEGAWQHLRLPFLDGIAEQWSGPRAVSWERHGGSHNAVGN